MIGERREDEERGQDSSHRRHLIVGTARLLAAAVALTMLVGLAVGIVPGWSVVASVLSVAVFLLVPLLLERTGSVELAGGLLVGCFTLLVLGLSWQVGGLDGPVLAFAAVIPLVAAMLLGRRAGWATACAIALWVVVLAGLHRQGFEFPRLALSPSSLAVAKGLMVAATALVAALLAGLFVNQNRSLLRELRTQSVRDALTGVSNRRHFDEVLEIETRRAVRTREELSLILFDLDYFKSYNDTYGHLKGDRCLVWIAQLAQAHFRRSSDLLARYGGEEFAVILPGATLEAARALAESLRHEVEAIALEHGGSPDQVVTISAGVATATALESLDPARLLSIADQALYEAKETGRNRVCVGGEGGGAGWSGNPVRYRTV